MNTLYITKDGSYIQVLEDERPIDIDPVYPGIKHILIAPEDINIKTVGNEGDLIEMSANKGDLIIVFYRGNPIVVKDENFRERMAERFQEYNTPPVKDLANTENI